MEKICLLLLLLTAAQLRQGWARSWVEIDISGGIDDPVRALISRENDPFVLSTEMPSAVLSVTPSSIPSSVASDTPSTSASPSTAPSRTSSLVPSGLPSFSPGTQPSVHPSYTKSGAPSLSRFPSDIPTSSLTPSVTRTLQPSELPSVSSAPSSAPSLLPSISVAPSSIPSDLPSVSTAPSAVPSALPSVSEAPSLQPSSGPSVSVTPSSAPTDLPSASMAPSSAPSVNPTVSAAPSSTPTDFPSRSPSSQPSNTPSVSNVPSSTKSDVPSDFPSHAPTFSPTDIPSIQPTPKPTKYPTNDPPVDPPTSYFNYDTNNNEFGPEKWDKIDVSKGTNNYWHEFLLEMSPYNNQCGRNRQSPIDLCQPDRWHCQEHHEFRSRPGDWDIDDRNITKQILPNMLRLLYARRTGDEPDPPSTDFAKNGIGRQDMTNIDIKVPSEHTLCGKRYDGEMQYFHYHSDRKNFITASFLLDASEGNPHNAHLQRALDEFQLVFEDDLGACSLRKRRARAVLRGAVTEREGRSGVFRVAAKGKVGEGGTNAAEAFGFSPLLSAVVERILHSYQDSHIPDRHLARKWDPFHKDIQRTIHFWGYRGSLTEPPCTELVDWRVMDVPTLITPQQLQQIQRLIFNHVDPGTCKMSSTHFEGSVARPINTHFSIPNYKCSRQDYKSDDEREKCGNKGCDPPHGKGLEPWVPPEFDVTAPPSKAPTQETL